MEKAKNLMPIPYWNATVYLTREPKHLMPRPYWKTYVHVPKAIHTVLGK